MHNRGITLVAGTRDLSKELKVKNLSLISGILFVIAFVPYVIAILRGQTKPSKTSWIIWAVLDTIALVGMMMKDTVNGQIVGALIGAWIIAGLALKFGKHEWLISDKICLVGAALAIGLMLVTGNPTFGIVTSGTAAFIGAFPTFTHAWKKPEEEDRLSWTIYWVSCICMMLGVSKWTLADATQPVIFFSIETIMMGILFIKPLFRRPATQN